MGSEDEKRGGERREERGEAREEREESGEKKTEREGGRPRNKTGAIVERGEGKERWGGREREEWR